MVCCYRLLHEHFAERCMVSAMVTLQSCKILPVSITNLCADPCAVLTLTCFRLLRGNLLGNNFITLSHVILATDVTIIVLHLLACVNKAIINTYVTDIVIVKKTFL